MERAIAREGRALHDRHAREGIAYPDGALRGRGDDDGLARRDVRLGQFRQRSARGHARVHEFDRFAGDVVAIAGTVRLVEVLRDARSRRIVRDREFETLAAVARVVLPLARDRTRALCEERLAALRVAALEDRAQRCGICVAGIAEHGVHVVGAQRSEGQAAGGEEARPLGDEHARDTQVRRDRARVQRAAAAEGDERELARVEAALDRHDPQHLRHRVVDERDDPGRRALRCRHPKRVRVVRRPRANGARLSERRPRGDARRSAVRARRSHR